jgi:hypothetical protein
VSDQQTVREAIYRAEYCNDTADEFCNVVGIDPDMPVAQLHQILEDGRGVQEVRDHFASQPKVDIVMPDEWFEEQAANLLDMEHDVLRRRLLWGERVEDWSTVRQVAKGGTYKKGWDDLMEVLTREEA